jgi:hypothetical protein
VFERVLAIISNGSFPRPGSRDGPHGTTASPASRRDDVRSPLPTASAPLRLRRQASVHQPRPT